MISLKRAAYFALAAAGLVACGPMDPQPQEQGLAQAENGLQTCQVFDALSYISQEDACDMARSQGEQFCASLGGVEYVGPCFHSAFSNPWRGGHGVCCNQ